jgi:putative Flp pilus-assembly TadE/G-like protein
MITRDRQRGQILVMFAGGLVAILLIAAIVFDIGQNLLDRRTEQNAADAAALAGARHLPAAYTYHGTCSAAGGGMPAVNIACDVAADNGFVDGTGNKTVRVDIPPVAPSTKAGFPGHIEVTIGATRGSFFSGVIGITTQRTGAMGVATNGTDIALPYSLLALDPHGCATSKITGARPSGVTTNGTVHVDSDCTTANGGALALTGNGVLTAPECDVVGGIKTAGGATNSCAAAPTGVLVYGDPLRNLPPPPKPGLPAAVEPLGAPTDPIPSGCPGGSSPATEVAPAACSFSSPSMNGKSYRIFPGFYPGGIAVTRATVYMDPGIYWIGGGGIDIRSNGPSGVFGALVSKDSGDNSGLAPSGGVLIYNSKLPNSAYGPIHLNGGDGSTLALKPIQSGPYENMVIFVDRTAATGNGDVDLNGAGSSLTISGTIYAPTGNVKLNGDASSAVGTQLICYNFVLNGNGGNMTLNYAPDDLFHLKGVGLVE